LLVRVFFLVWGKRQQIKSSAEIRLGLAFGSGATHAVGGARCCLACGVGGALKAGSYVACGWAAPRPVVCGAAS
jgi:hypothetical protein